MAEHALTRAGREAFASLEVELTSDAPPFDEFEMTEVGNVAALSSSSVPMLARRTASLIDDEPYEVVQLNFLDRGRALVTQDGREVYLEAGEFTILDQTRPFTASIPSHFSTRVFQFSKSALGIPDRDLARITARPLRQDHALSTFLIPFLNRLSRDGARLHPTTRDQLAHNVTDIVSTLISDHLQDVPLEDKARQTLVLRIKSYMLDNLDAPDLSPERIATAHHVSVRYLHKLFASEDTTVSRWVLHERLEHCKRDLAMFTPQSRSIGETAYAWGFMSAAHFSRVFRDHYGMSPSEWQQHSWMTQG